MPLLNYNNRTISYETFGEQKNPCIIMIMGIGGQLIIWPDEIPQELAKKGFYVITFDNRDSGLSQHYDHLATPNLMEAIIAKQQSKLFQLPYTLKDMADDVIALMDGLKIAKANIVGISLGGIIAQILAIDYSSRLLNLVLMETTSGDPMLPPAQPEILQYFLTPKLPVKNVEEYVQQMLSIYRLYNHPNHINENEARDLFTRVYYRAYYPQGFQRTLLAMIFAQPRTQALKNVQAKTLIIHGDYDPVFSIEHGQQLAMLIREGRLEIIEHLGHGLPKSECQRMVDLIAEHCK